MSTKEVIQETLYTFPYHYIPKLDDGGFSQSQSLPWGFEYLMYVEYLIYKILLISPCSVCDYGCGDGRLLNELSNYESSPEKMIGIDKSDRAIGFANLFRVSNKVNFVVKLDIDDKFDVISCIEVLEHIEPLKIFDFINEMSSYLKPQGKIILTVPSKTQKVNDKHYQHFDVKDLNQIIFKHKDLRIVESVYLIKRTKLRNLVFRLFDNKYFIFRNRTMLGIIYRWYKEKFLISEPNKAAKILIVIEKQ